LCESENASLQDFNFPKPFGKTIPGSMLAHVAALSSEVNSLKASGISDEDALRTGFSGVNYSGLAEKRDVRAFPTNCD
jgi:hypothetical protein